MWKPCVASGYHIGQSGSRVSQAKVYECLTVGTDGMTRREEPVEV